MRYISKAAASLKGHHFLFILCAAVLVVFSASPASAQQTLTVMTSEDSSAPGVASLRNLIAQANDLDATVIIEFSSALSGSTIHLNSEIVIAKRFFDLTIKGPGPFELMLDGQGRNRIFRVQQHPLSMSTSFDVNISGVRLVNGKGDLDGGGAVLHNRSTSAGGKLTLSNCIIENNSADGAMFGGGGISNFGNMEITECRISSNSARNAARGGGGIYSGGDMDLTGVTVDQNFVNGGDSIGGGGISNSGLLVIDGSTISDNFANGTAFGGGGIYNENLPIQRKDAFDKIFFEATTTTVRQSTIADNSASQSESGGGGIWNAGTIKIQDTQIVRNQAFNQTFPGGAAITNGGDVVTLTNTLIINNVGTPTDVNCFDSALLIVNTGNVVSDDATCGFGQVVNDRFDPPQVKSNFITRGLFELEASFRATADVTAASFQIVELPEWAHLVQVTITPNAEIGQPSILRSGEVLTVNFRIALAPILPFTFRVNIVEGTP